MSLSAATATGDCAGVVGIGGRGHAVMKKDRAFGRSLNTAGSGHGDGGTEGISMSLSATTSPGDSGGRLGFPRGVVGSGGEGLNEMKKDRAFWRSLTTAGSGHGDGGTEDISKSLSAAISPGDCAGVVGMGGRGLDEMKKDRAFGRSLTTAGSGHGDGGTEGISMSLSAAISPGDCAGVVGMGGRGLDEMKKDRAFGRSLTTAGSGHGDGGTEGISMSLSATTSPGDCAGVVGMGGRGLDEMKKDRAFGRSLTTAGSGHGDGGPEGISMSLSAAISPGDSGGRLGFPRGVVGSGGEGLNEMKKDRAFWRSLTTAGFGYGDGGPEGVSMSLSATISTGDSGGRLGFPRGVVGSGGEGLDEMKKDRAFGRSLTRGSSGLGDGLGVCE